MKLDRPTRSLPVVSIVPLIDVLLILLVFFIVTSTFLDLDMLPLSSGENGGSTSEIGQAATVLVRVVPDGNLAVAGREIPVNEMAHFFEGLGPARLLVLPAPQAELQVLVTVLEHVANAGISDVQIVRFGANE